MNDNEKIISALETISTSILHMQSDITALRQDNAVIEKEIGKVIARSDITNIRLDELEKNQALIEQTLKRAVTELSEVKGELSEVKGELSEVKGDVSDLKIGLAQTNKKLSETIILIENETNKEIKIVSEQYTGIAKKLDDIRRMAEKTHEDVAVMKMVLSAHDREIHALKTAG